MAFIEVRENFKVETFDVGRKDFEAKFYSYRIMTNQPKEKTLEFCENVLNTRFPRTPDLVEFEKTASFKGTSIYNYIVRF